ncbi:MAG: TolC family protein [Sphingomonadales bacterium]|nr:TolC family protein [Sphingomonadales bacterium]
MRPTLPLYLLGLVGTPAAAQDLPATIAAALAHAPAMAEARAGEDAAAARNEAARAERNPTLTLEGSYGAGRIDNGGFFGFTAAGTTPLSLRAAGDWPLWTGGRVAAAVAGAGSGVAMAKAGTQSTAAAVTVEAVATYADVVGGRRLLAQAKQLTAELDVVARQAHLRFQVGEIPASDLAAARARKAEGEAGLALAEARLASAEAHYQRLTGAPAGELAPLPALPVLPASLDEATDRAHAANPALRQAEEGVAAARAGARAARAEGRPTIGAFAEATRMRDQFFPGYKADAMAVGVRGRWTPFAGGRVSAKIREADAAIGGAEARAAQARLALDGAVIDAWTGFRAAQRMVEASALRVAAAREVLRSSKLEASVGEKTTLQVLDAEREVMAAEAAEIDAEGRRLVAAWQINALAGNATP